MKFSRLVQLFISTKLAISQQNFVYLYLAADEYIDILAAAKGKTWQEG